MDLNKIRISIKILDSGNEDENQQEEEDDSDLELERPRPQAPRNLEHYLDLLSRPQERREGNSNNQGDPKIKSLPVEVLLQIFSYLDDLSMWSVSEVCKQWRDILEENTHQAMWKKYTRERFPIFVGISHIPNWFHVSRTKNLFTNSKFLIFLNFLDVFSSNEFLLLSKLFNPNGHKKNPTQKRRFQSF